MISNVHGIVLSRRWIGEYDRLAVILTLQMGRLTARFSGVERPRGKLKALAEPMACGELRLYMGPRSEFGKVIGGQVIDTFPAVRADLSRTLSALACCELAAHLTAEQAPNPAEYRLLHSALEALSGEAPSPWIEAAFGLQLLEAAGLGMPASAAAPADRPAWAVLRESPLGALSLRPDASSFERLRQLVYARAEEHASRAFQLKDFGRKLSQEAAPA